MPTRPLIRLPLLAAVVVGGMIGVVLRELLLLPFSGVAGAITLPTATVAVNVVGSFALGAVAGWFGTRRPLTRAFIGTGVLGGFTTYSAFAVQTATLLSSAPFFGFLFGVVSVLLGVAAAALGLRLVQGRAPASDEPVVDPGENS